MTRRKPVSGAGPPIGRWLLALLACAIWATASARTLHFWAVTSSVRDVQMYRALAQRFEQTYGVHVEVTPLAWGNFQTKYFAAMAAGLPPDVGVTNLGGPFDYGSVGGVIDLRAAFPKETKELESRFNPKILRMFTIGHSLYGIPSDLSTLVMYYRTDVFDRLGLHPPKTWSELNRVIGALEANGYRYYFGFTAGAQWAIGLYTIPYGLPGFERDAKGNPVVDWLNPKYLSGVFEGLRLWHMHDSPGMDLGSRIVGMFRSNDPSVEVPLMIDLHTVAGQLHRTAPDIEGKWGVAPWPKADDGKPYSVMGGTSYVIFRQSKMQHEALQWVSFLNTLDVQRYMVLDRLNRGDESALTISPLKSFWGPENDSFWKRPELQNSQHLHAVLAQVFPTFATVPEIHGSVEASRLEANLLDQMGSSIRDKLGAIAQRHDLSREQLVQRFGKGDFAQDRAQLEASSFQELKSGYAAIAPQAEQLLRTESQKYGERFGKIIKDLPKYEKQTNLMDVVKIAAALLILGLCGAVLAFRKYRRHLVSYAFVGAPLILAIIFVFVPAVAALYLSFTEYHPVMPLSTARWVGIENYRDVLTSGDLAQSLAHTFRYAAITLPVGILLALGFAYLLNAKLVGERYWRFLYFSPLVTSVVSIALIFSQLFLGGKQGWLNAFLLWIGAIRDPIPFLTSDKTFLNCVIVLAIWHGLAFTILIFLAGLQQIPAQLFEAAEVDGAGPVRRFWNVAVPGIRPQVFFVTVLGVMGSLQVFETIYTLANKSGDAGARFGPNDSAMTMVPLIYHTGFETFEMGKSTAIAYVLFLMILILTVVQIQFYRRKSA